MLLKKIVVVDREVGTKEIFQSDILKAYVNDKGVLEIWDGVRTLGQFTHWSYWRFTD